ncbi:MAG: acyl--CoA ligase [Pseudomonadales bacterium]|nr:acyl--CoA ligase [Pseudomonadales bacterium]
MSEIVAKIAESTAQLTAEGSPWQLGQTTINGVEYKYYPGAPKTLAELLDGGRNHDASNEFLIYQDERMSFGDFFAKVDALAAALQQSLQLSKGDRVAIAMRNYPEWMIAFAATIYAGGVPVPLNSWGQAAELEYGLNDSGAKFAFFDQQRFNYIEAELESLGVTAIVARPDNAITAPHFDQDALTQAGTDLSLESPEVDPEDIGMIMYTSGTTGNPKGAVSTHRAVCQAIFNFELAANIAAMSDFEPVGKMLERGFPPKVLLAVPLFHVSGCHSVFFLSLRGGRPIVMMYKWDKVNALQLIQNERITMISAVPTMLIDLLDADEWADYDTSSMFGFGAGGSAQPPGLADKIYEKLPDSFPGTGYGMTETNATGFAMTGRAYRENNRSGGIITPIVDVRIVDANGTPVAQGEAGEIQLKTPTAVSGYWGNEAASQDTFVDGWVVTGDIGHLDEHGFVYITDRIKDMVIRGGENIASLEVEAACSSLDSVAECAVYGLPNDTLGEEVAISVVPKPGQTVTANEVQAHIATQLAAFKVPSKVFIETEALPRNATMKVLKNLLKSKYC